MPVITTIKVRRGTAAAWASTNPVLAVGELGLETDTGVLRYGDGTTAFSSLPALFGGTGSAALIGASSVPGLDGTNVQDMLESAQANIDAEELRAIAAEAAEEAARIADVNAEEAARTADVAALQAGKRGKTETIIRLRDFATGNGTDENLAIQAALTDLATAGRPGVLEIDKAPTEYLTSVPLVPPAGLRIFGAGSDVSVIRQASWGKPVFDLIDKDDVTVEGVGVTYTGDRTTQALPSFRGQAGRTYSAGIWTNGERNVFRDVRVTGFVIGVSCGNWNGASLAGYRVGNRIEGLVVDDVDWGVLFFGQDDFYFDVSGSYSLSPGSSDPSHLVYGSGVAADLATDNRQISIGPCMAWDGTGGHAYQLKNITGGRAVSLLARNCEGILNMLKVVGFSVPGLVETACAGTSGAGTIIVGSGCERVKIESPLIDMAVEQRVVTLAGSDCEMSNATVSVNRSTVSDNVEIDVTGTRNAIRRLKSVNAGAGGAILVNVATGADHVVEIASAVGHKKAVVVNAGATNALVSYDPTRVVPSVAAGDNARHTQVLEPTTVVRLDSANPSARTVAAGSFLPNYIQATRHGKVTFQVNDATGFTIPNPIEAALGAQLTIEVHNNTAGALGTITWGAAYDAALWVSPAAGERSSITFEWDATKWRHVASGGVRSASLADVQSFTANGTWTKPLGNFSKVTVRCVGGGGGGGSGRRGAAGTVRCGGGGGGGGGITTVTYPYSQVPSTQPVTIGAGGAGGAAVGTDDTNGANGATGGTTAWGTTGTAAAATYAAGGGPGIGGSAASGAGGTAGLGQLTVGTGGAASTTGGAGVVGGNGATAGGGAGGGLTTGNVAAAGGAGGTNRENPRTGGTAGAVDTNGGTPAVGSASWDPTGGSGGGGGGAHSATAAGTGGTGGAWGGGGGGGGASLNGTASGAGGVGGAGFCQVITE